MTRSIRCSLVALAVLAAGCRSAAEGGSVGPSVLYVVSGANQQGVVGTILPTQVAVQVRDAGGNPVPGLTVAFAISSGGGTLNGDSVTTDASGEATLSQWILGTTPGQNAVIASVVHTTLATTITATAVSGGGVTIQATGTQGFVGLVSSAVTNLPTVLVSDSYRNPVPGVVVTFHVTAGGGSIGDSVVTTGSNGTATLPSWTLGSTPGANTVIASTPSGASITFTAQALTSAPVLTATSPTSQSGYLNLQVPSIPRVTARDAGGHLLTGVPVTFAVTTGDGVVLSGSSVTDTSGSASPQDWKMGNDVVTTVAATTGLGAAPVVFSATGTTAPFSIDIRFLTTVSPDVRDAFVVASRRWIRVFTAHLSPVQVKLPAGECSLLQPAINETVTDLIIYAEVSPVDGVGGILGESSPCATRSTSGLPAVGSMAFDAADLAALVTTNQLVPTITHEICHVLGFGTLWDAMHVVSGLGTSDPIFTGAAALLEWPPFASALDYNGRPIPVENSGGSGTAGSHWRESVFGAELMTGYIEAPGVPMPLSKMTLASLRDLGYGVDYSQADLFVGNLRAPNARVTPPQILNEVLSGPKWQLPPVGAPMRINP
ncbi:MAG TPA: Ig-like domain-containing protein [Gemmatimonadales bacterium]|jgi:hypothetical protein